MHSSMCPTVHGLGFVHCGQIAWKKWPTNWHAHVSRWLMLSCHWQLWVLLPMCLFDCLLVFSFVGFGLVREGRYTRVNVLYSSYTSLLDHIYIQNCTIFMSGVLDTYYSDHDAIFADIALHGYQQWVPQLTRSGLKGDLYVIFRQKLPHFCPHVQPFVLFLGFFCCFFSFFF